MANSEMIIDTQVYLSWLDAVSKCDTDQAEFLKERFREEFKPAFEAWIVRRLTIIRYPPGTPFALPEYQLAEFQKSNRLEEEASAAFQPGNDANQNGDLYIANTAFFAIVLFYLWCLYGGGIHQTYGSGCSWSHCHLRLCRFYDGKPSPEGRVCPNCKFSHLIWHIPQPIVQKNGVRSIGSEKRKPF
jgi:hypothetical protein